MARQKARPLHHSAGPLPTAQRGPCTVSECRAHGRTAKGLSLNGIEFEFSVPRADKKRRTPNDEILKKIDRTGFLRRQVQTGVGMGTFLRARCPAPKP